MTALEASFVLAGLGVLWGVFTMNAYGSAREFARRECWRDDDKERLKEEYDRLDRVLIWHRVVVGAFTLPLVLQLFALAVLT